MHRKGVMDFSISAVASHVPGAYLHMMVIVELDYDQLTLFSKAPGVWGGGVIGEFRISNVTDLCHVGFQKTQKYIKNHFMLPDLAKEV